MESEPINVVAVLDQINARLDAHDSLLKEHADRVGLCIECSKPIVDALEPPRAEKGEGQAEPEPFDAKVWAKRMVRMASMPCYEGVLKLFDHKSVWCHGDFKHTGQSAMNAARGAIEESLTAAREPLVREVIELKEKLSRVAWEKLQQTDRAKAAEARVRELESHPCNIHEHDGAYQCGTCGKRWGAITNPDQPCPQTAPAETREELAERLARVWVFAPEVGGRNGWLAVADAVLAMGRGGEQPLPTPPGVRGKL